MHLDIYTVKIAKMGVFLHTHTHKRTSFPSRSAMVTTTVPPVALAMRFRSSFLTLRMAMAPASTKYFRHRSSMPLVVRITWVMGNRCDGFNGFDGFDGFNRVNRQVRMGLIHRRYKGGRIKEEG
jgi:hypothetical protein